MAKIVPEKIKYFLKNALEDFDDGYEYANELCRLVNSDECQINFSNKEIESLKDFADDVKKVGEFNYYSKAKVKDLELERFGVSGISGYLGIVDNNSTKPLWPF